jgi:hypothetical protein
VIFIEVEHDQLTTTGRKVEHTINRPRLWKICMTRLRGGHSNDHWRNETKNRDEERLSLTLLFVVEVEGKYLGGAKGVLPVWMRDILLG